PVGIQAIEAEAFPVTRTITTGSWLGQAHQGSGIGTRMRALVLHLAFVCLGAEVATTGAWAARAPSTARSTRPGGRPNGASRQVREGQAVEHRYYRRDREDDDMLAAMRARLLGEVQLDGIDELRKFLQIPTDD